MKKALLTFVILLAFGAGALAHDPGLSTLNASLRGEKLEILLGFAPADVANQISLDANGDGTISSREFDAAGPTLQTRAEEGLTVEIDGRTLRPGPVEARLKDAQSVTIRLVYTLPEGSNLSLRSRLDGFPSGHRQFAAFRDGRGEILSERLLDVRNDRFQVALNDLASAERAHDSIFGQFFFLGIEHIATGYDHLLFLLALLLVVTSLGMSAKIITAFTLAHSATLALAVLDVVRLPGSVVEPLIAASVVFVGLENLFSRRLQYRTFLAFGFGLIHGLGFASILVELGVGTTGREIAYRLLSFNLGVEAGQMAIAALILPLLWKLRQRPAFQPRFVPVLSMLLVATGLAWLVERTLV